MSDKERRDKVRSCVREAARGYGTEENTSGRPAWAIKHIARKALLPSPPSHYERDYLKEVSREIDNAFAALRRSGELTKVGFGRGQNTRYALAEERAARAARTREAAKARKRATAERILLKLRPSTGARVSEAAVDALIEALEEERIRW